MRTCICCQKVINNSGWYKGPLCTTCYQKTPHGKKIHDRYRQSKKSKDYQRDYQLKLKFNITLEDYNTLLQQQSFVCAICLNPETERSSRGTKIKSLAVDHDHDTKKVRGLLCSRCNWGIGTFENNSTWLANASNYLKGNK